MAKDGARPVLEACAHLASEEEVRLCLALSIHSTANARLDLNCGLRLTYGPWPLRLV